MGECCAICGEPLDDTEPHDTLTTGQPVCADPAACVRRWVAMTTEQRDRIRHLDPSTNVETR
jgi:hypothetical protein